MPLAIGRKYSDVINCDVVEMDAMHILLGRLWQFDVDATRHGRLNQYVIKVGDSSHVALMPLPSEAPTENDKPNLLIQPKSEFYGLLNMEKQGLAMVVRQRQSKVELFQIVYKRYCKSTQPPLKRTSIPYHQ